MIIGITGGTGCGKTTLLNLIRGQGGLILDCDVLYHNLLKTDRVLLDLIDAQFPGTVENSILNRKKLGQIVFRDPNALADLNAITYGIIKKEVIRILEPKPRLAAIDAIGLFESGLAELCDVTVAVTAPIEDRVIRLMSRDSIDEHYARARISSQKSEQWYREKCGYILENNGTIECFKGKCLAFLQQIDIMK